MQPQYYIGIMSGTSMDGADAVLIQMQGKQWQRAVAHSFLPYSDGLRQELLALQDIGENELHRSNILAQTLSRLYTQTVNNYWQNKTCRPKTLPQSAATDKPSAMRLNTVTAFNWLTSPC